MDKVAWTHHYTVGNSFATNFFLHSHGAPSFTRVRVTISKGQIAIGAVHSGKPWARNKNGGLEGNEGVIMSRRLPRAEWMEYLQMAKEAFQEEGNDASWITDSVFEVTLMNYPYAHI